MEHRAASVYPGPSLYAPYGAPQQLSHVQPVDYKGQPHDMTAVLIDRPRPPLKSAVIKKAASTPNIRSLINHDTAQMSAADKKRNKLGYHRTAVACGHCRRRKIRCIPSSDTSTTRCQNCIRLKKDCQFYPVDQATQPTAKRAKNDSKGEALNAESETSVSSSSPGLQSGMDPYDPYRPQMASPPLTQGATGYQHLAPSSAMPGQSEHEYDYPPPYANTSWHQPGMVNQPPRYFGEGRPSNEAQQRGYWHDQEHPNQDSFAPTTFPMTSSASTVTVTSPESTYSYPPTTQDYHYSPQTSRDMSNGSSGSMMPYTMYRANTMPDLNQSMTQRNVHPGSMNISPQSMMSPQFTAPRSQTQYPQPPGIAPRWSEPNQVQPGFLTHGNGQTWFSASGGLADVREEQDSRSQVLPPQQVTPGQFRPNPG